MLYGIINRHDTVEDMYKEAMTQFKWKQSQAEAAIKPLLKRNTSNKISTKSTKKVATRKNVL
jgi:hypothetical protein